MKYVVVNSEGRFTGTVYDGWEQRFADHHAQYGEYLCELNRVPEDGEVLPLGDLIEGAVNRILAEADAFTKAVFPPNERERINAWLARPDTDTRSMMAEATLAWSDRLWDAYYAAKTQARAGNWIVRFTFTEPRPYTWAQILADTP